MQYKYLVKVDGYGKPLSTLTLERTYNAILHGTLEDERLLI